MLPSVFVSHGAPTLPLEDVPARDFLRGFGGQWGRPDAILCISAHWERAAPALSRAERPETIHDFYGFPKPLYDLRYPAPGAPDLAAQAGDLLAAAGIAVDAAEDRGLDHGAWVPLMMMYPDADIPVTQLSVQTAMGPAAHTALGRALAPLRKAGVLILASGGAVHNLREWRAHQNAVPAWAQAFDDWLADKIATDDRAALQDYRTLAPEGPRAHPTEEHFLPLFVALGAAEGSGRVLHRSFASGGLSMAAYAFG